MVALGPGGGGGGGEGGGCGCEFLRASTYVLAELGTLHTAPRQCSRALCGPGLTPLVPAGSPGMPSRPRSETTSPPYRLRLDTLMASRVSCTATSAFVCSAPHHRVSPARSSPASSSGCVESRTCEHHVHCHYGRAGQGSVWPDRLPFPSALQVSHAPALSPADLPGPQKVTLPRRTASRIASALSGGLTPPPGEVSPTRRPGRADTALLRRRAASCPPPDRMAEHPRRGPCRP